MSDSIFQDGTLNMRNKLGMVNICLAAIGEIPLESDVVLEDLPAGTDGAIARDMVSKAMLEVQNNTYYFNTDYSFTFIPDENGFIPVPSNLLRIDVGKTKHRSKIYIKNNKLYNNTENTFIFKGNVKADAVFLIDYDKLPFDAWNYIAHVAARKFQNATVSSPDLDNTAKEEEERARRLLVAEDLRYKDISLLGKVSNRNKNPNPNWY